MLVDDGMQVFESTAMKRLEDHTVYTHGGSITADHIIIAVDKLEPHRSARCAAEVFHAQTFLSVTEPLTDKRAQHPVSVGRADAVLGLEAGLLLFPADGRQSPAARRRLGDHHVPEGRVQQSRRSSGASSTDFYEHFPQLKSLSFIQFWPGQIDTTRDLLPTIVRPKDQPHLRFILGCVGIPWATFSGSFAARNVLGEADDDYRKYFNYFSNERYFWLPSSLGNVIGKPMLFSLSNSWAKFQPGRQVARDRGRPEGILRPKLRGYFAEAAALSC